MFDIEKWISENSTPVQENKTVKNKIFSDKNIFKVSTIFSIFFFIAIYTPFIIKDRHYIIINQTSGYTLPVIIFILIICIFISCFIWYFINNLWKRRPHTIKIGIIVGSIAILFNIALYFCILSANLNPDKYAGLICILFPIPELLVYWMLSPFLWVNELIPEVYWPILSVIVWFIIGSLIGFIIDYRKLIKKGQ